MGVKTLQVMVTLAPPPPCARGGRNRFHRLADGCARRSAEEGPLRGSDREDAHRDGSDALMAGSTVASPQAGPLLRVPPSPAAGCKSPEIRVLLCAFTVASRKRVPAPRSGAPPPSRGRESTFPVASRIFQQLRRDDVALDFGGAFVDARDPRIAERGLDARFAHVAHAAVNLHRRVHDFAERLGREQLCH